MGRAEKKFQKKKERERAVRKKILKKRAAALEVSKEIRAQERLEREIEKAERKKWPNYSHYSLEKASPELKETLALLDNINDDENQEASPTCDDSEE